MSVAFRRESDDEHLEPKFELPIPPGPNLVTSRGMAQIRARVAELEAELKTLTGEDEIKALRRQLRYWGTRQATMELVPVPDGSSVAFGCAVTFQMNGTDRTITIVGDDEADPAESLISFSSPLARALIGAEPGEKVDFANRQDAIEVVSISVLAA